MERQATLSPAAQAVFYAFNSKFDWIEDGVPGPQFNAIAAALRAAADQILNAQWQGRIDPDTCHRLGINWSRDALHAIASELEATS